MVRFSVEEVPLKDNIPLEPLCGVEGGVTENGHEPEPVASQPLLNNGINEDNGVENSREVPTITVTTENGDPLINRIRVEPVLEDEG